MTLKHRTAIVTGAAGKGMGRSIALTLARQGANVVVNYRTSADSAQAVVKHITDNGGAAVAFQADVFTADGCKQLVDASIQQFRQVDICIIGPGADWRPGPIHKIEPDPSLQDVQQELAPLFYLMPLLLPRMWSCTSSQLLPSRSRYG